MYLKKKLYFQKISAKNAFDVNVEFLENLPNFLNKNEESAWQKASASLDASAKIYGYRVDCVHSDTFKFLGGLNRTENKDEENENLESKILSEKVEKKVKFILLNVLIQDGSSTLEKDPKKLDLTHYDMEFDVDPLFKNMTARFNETGARGLLLNNLPIDSNLDLLLESKDGVTLLEFKNKMTDELIKTIQGKPNFEFDF